MKVSIVKCKASGHVIAGCNVDDGYPARWYKSLGMYAASGRWEIEEKESDGYIFDEKGCDKCIKKKK